MKKTVLFFLLIPLAYGAWGQLSADEEELLRLDTHLANIRDDARAQRYTGGLIELGIGAGIGGLGYFGIQQIPSDMPEVRQGALLTVGVTSGAFLLPGLFILAMKSDYERLPDEYFAMFTLSESDRQKRRIKGELAIKSLSEKAFGERITSAVVSLSLAFGSAGVSSNNPSLGSTSWLLLANGIASIVFPKKAEMEYESFRLWQQKSLVRADSADWSWQSSLSASGQPQLIVKANF